MAPWATRDQLPRRPRGPSAEAAAQPGGVEPGARRRRRDPRGRRLRRLHDRRGLRARLGRADRHLRPHDQQGRAVPRRLRARHREHPGRAGGLRRPRALGRAGAGRPGPGRPSRELVGISLRHQRFLRAVVLVSGGHPEVQARRGSRYVPELARPLRRRRPAARATRSRTTTRSAPSAAASASSFSTTIIRRRLRPGVHHARRPSTTTPSSPTWARSRCATCSAPASLRQLRAREPWSAARPGTCGRRSGRNAARISVANSSGSSQAAKWPPRSTSLK